MFDGWIKLHRKIRENPVFNDMQLFRLWIICLTEATYKERDQMVGKQLAHLMPGEFVTGRFSLNELYNSGLGRKENKPPTTTWRWLEILEKNEFVVIKSNNKYSVVSILKWQDYQQSIEQDGQQVVNKRSTDGQQVVTNKKEKKENNVNKETYAEFVTMSESEYQKLIEAHGEVFVKKCIEELDNHKGAKGQSYKSDYRAILKWVVSKVKEDAEKAKGFRPTNKQQSNLQVVPMSDQERKEYRDAYNKQLERNGVSPAVNG